jgi:hypothetical protein
MNRIRKYLENGRKIATEMPEKPKKCAFCEREFPEAKDVPKFLVFAKSTPDIIMCECCLDKYAVLRATEKVLGIYCRRESWDPLKTGICKRIAGEQGTPFMKKTAGDILLCLAQRSAAVFAGAEAKGFEICPITNVHLGPKRISLVGQNAMDVLRLVEAAAPVVGMPTQWATPASVARGDAERLLAAKYNHDPVMEHCGILLVEGGCIVGTHRNAVFACANSRPPAGSIQVCLDEPVE